MKKSISFVLAVVLMLSLSACGKSDAAKAVDDQISAIGTVTLESQAQIIAAEEAVAALSAEDLKQLDNVALLEQAHTTYDTLVLEAQAGAVDEFISAIGTVTLESADAISTARAQFDGSDAEVQALVTGLPTLEQAEQALSDLRTEQAIELIAAIGDVTLESGPAVKAAQDAFNALSAADAAKVTNADLLQAAADQLKQLKTAQADALLAKLHKEEDKVRGMSFYYASTFKFYSNGSWAADQRCFVLPYLGRDANSAWLRLLFNYTGDDWVFFKKITLAVDDARYYKTFQYFDIVRDNGGGDVWEYIDTEATSSDVEMLWAIVNSTETIIRFEGDDYSHDFIINASDKQAIRDLLTVYEALQ